MPEPGPSCPRCGSVALRRTGSPDTVRFFGCPQCGRRYAQTPGGPLTERWPGPLGLALYGVLFAERPQDEAVRVAASMGHLDVAAIAAEIRLELRQPSQPVRAILPGLRAGEADLRDYLARLADELETDAAPPASGD